MKLEDVIFHSHRSLLLMGEMTAALGLDRTTVP